MCERERERERERDGGGENEKKANKGKRERDKQSEGGREGEGRDRGGERDTEREEEGENNAVPITKAYIKAPVLPRLREPSGCLRSCQGTASLQAFQQLPSVTRVCAGRKAGFGVTCGFIQELGAYDLKF